MGLDVVVVLVFVVLFFGTHFVTDRGKVGL